MKGIMLGIVSVEGVADPCVGLRVNDQDTVVLAVNAALNIYMQLGEILDQLGAFPDPEPEKGEQIH